METRKPPSLPRVLLVEDDTISQAYFRAVLEALPAAVDAVTTSDAETRARAEREQREYEREQRRCEERQRRGRDC